MAQSLEQGQAVGGRSPELGVGMRGGGARWVPAEPGAGLGPPLRAPQPKARPRRTRCPGQGRARALASGA